MLPVKCCLYSSCCTIVHVDYLFYRASPFAQRGKCLPAMQESQVWFLSWEDPLEEEMASHSNILAWKTPGTEEPGDYRPRSHKSQTQLSDQTAACIS